MTNLFGKRILGFFIKIVLPSFLAILLFISFMFFVLKPLFEDALMNKKREMIKELVHSAKSILQKYYNDEKEGLLSREEAQRTAISRIQYLRYGSDNKDYFWITDLKPTMIMHPYVIELVGKDLSNYTDPSGKKLFLECVEVVKNNKSGYVEYMWQFKDDSLHILPKISYVSIFEPWQWIIGTGVYIDDVKKEISQLTNKLINTSLIITTIIIFILLFIAFQSYKIEKKRQKAESMLQLSYEKYRSLVEASTEALVMIKNFKITQANEWFYKLIEVDYVIDENISKYIAIPPNIKELMELQVQQIQPFETTIFTCKQTNITVLINISRVNIVNEIYYVLTIRDISPIKHINKKIETTYEKIKELLDSIQIGYIRTSIDYKGKILDTNKAALHLLGFNTIDDLKNTYIIDLYADNNDKRIIRKELFLNERIENKKIQIKKSNGSIETILVSLRIVKDDNNNPIYAEGFMKPFEESYSLTRLFTLFANKDISLNNSLDAFLLPTQTTNLNTPLDSILNNIVENEYKYLLVENEHHEILGYITSDEIMHVLVHSQKNENLKAFQLMKSPIYYVNRETTLSHILAVLKNSKTQLLLVKDSSQNLKVFFLPEYYKKQSHYLANDINNLRESHSYEKIKSIKISLIHQIATQLLIDNYCYNNLLLLSEIHDAIVHAIIKNAFNEIGEPPCQFAFIVMGSEARREQSFSTDQDNAIIYEKLQYQDYFKQLGSYISYNLNILGYEYCKGNNMASNEKWNQPLNEWKKYFTYWIQHGNGQDLLDINIFFDLRTVFGNDTLREELIKHIQAENTKHKAYILLLAQNAIQTKIHIGSTVHIKEFISLLVNIIRIYALYYNIPEISTLQRVSKMLELKIINSATYYDVINIFHFLNALRLKYQAKQMFQHIKPNNHIDSKLFSEFEIYNLRYCITVIQSLQNKLLNDFKVY